MPQISMQFVSHASKQLIIIQLPLKMPHVTKQILWPEYKFILKITKIMLLHKHVPVCSLIYMPLDKPHITNRIKLKCCDHRMSSCKKWWWLYHNTMNNAMHHVYIVVEKDGRTQSNIGTDRIKWYEYDIHIAYMVNILDSWILELKSIIFDSHFENAFYSRFFSILQ